MAKHDIVTYNSSSKGFETELNNNTAQIKGDASTVFSVESASGASIFSVGTSNASVVLGANFTASGHLSSSLSSTASFAKVEFISITGSSNLMTNTNQIGHISTSAQLSTAISGAFNAGFQTTGDISGSRTSTGSFGTVFANEYEGDASLMTNVNEQGHISSSAQLATSISGSFTSGFEFTGEISGSRTSTGSFTKLISNKYTGDASNVTNIKVHEVGFVSSSAQLATAISGSFNKGFEYTGLLGTPTPTPTTTQSIKLDESDDYMKIIPMFTSGSDGDDKLYGERRFTFSTWIKFNADNDSRNTFIAAGAAAGAQNGLYVWMEDNIIKVQFKVKHGSTMSDTGVFNSGNIALNKWHHLLLSYESNRPNPTASGSFIAALDGIQNFGKVMQSGSYIDNPAPTVGDSVIGTYSAAGENSNMTIADITMWKHSIQSASTDAGITSGSLMTTLFNHGIVPDYTASFSTGYPDAYREKLKFAFNFNSASYAGSSYSMYDRTGNTGFTLTSTDVDQGKIVSGSGDYPTEGVFYTTGSFGRVIIGNKITAGSATGVTNVPITAGSISSSAQLATSISGSFNKGFEFSGTISGSATSTGSFGIISASNYANITDASGITKTIFQVSASGAVSSSAQLATSISGSFTSGFGFAGEISGSRTSTGSFNRVDSTFLSGDGSRITGLQLNGVISSSAQLATSISGSFNKGFEYIGAITSPSLGAWTEVSEQNTARDYTMAAGGNGGAVDTRNSALLFGGRDYPAVCSITEEWNGTSWSEVGDMNTGRNKGAGFGSTEAAVAVGGNPGSANHSTNTEEYDGSEWNTGEAFPTPAGGHMTSAGTLPAGMVMNGGYSPGTTGGANQGQASTENVNYDGTDWSAGDNLNLSLSRAAGGGTQNSAIIFGGLDPSSVGSSCTEVYDGSSWSVAAAMIYKRAEFGGDAASENDALTGGNTYPSPGGGGGYGGQKTEIWNGTAWSEKVDLPNIYNYGAHIEGKSSGGLLFGGYVRNPGLGLNTTVLNWTENSVAGMTTTGSFGAVQLNSSTRLVGGLSSITLNETGFVSSSAQLATAISGSFNKGFSFGGAMSHNQYTGSVYVGVSGSAFAEAGNATTMSISSICGSDFDYRLDDQIAIGNIKGRTIGTGNWIAGPNRNTVQSGMSGIGTQNAYLSAGGYKAPKNGTEKFDGTAWSLSANLPEENCTQAGFGTQNAAALAGGQQGSPAALYVQTYLYNGATWSESGDTNVARRMGGSAGTQNAGLVFAGTGPSPSPNTDHAHTETFDGNTWTEVNNLNTGRAHVASGGTQNSAIAAAGFVHGGSLVSNTELWNGTNWTETADVNTARNGAAGIGTQNHFLVTGGSTPSFTGNTEEWNGTSWSEVNDLINARGTFSGGQGGLGTAGILAGGQSTSAPNYLGSNCTELWNDNYSSGSFGILLADNWEVQNVRISNTFPNVTLSTDISSLSSHISGSFQRGFEFAGTISGSADSTGSLSHIKSDIIQTDKMNVVFGLPISASSLVSGSDLTQSFHSFTTKPFVIPYAKRDFFDTRKFFPASSSKQQVSCGSCTEQYASEEDFVDGDTGTRSFVPDYEAGAQISIGDDGILNITFQTSSLVSANLRGIQPAAWSSAPDLLTATRPSGVGTTNASLAISGRTVAEAGGGGGTSVTQHYNGVSWRQGGQILEQKGPEGIGQAFGTQNAAGAVPSRTSGPTRQNLHYNGSAWYYVKDSANNADGQGSAGSVNAAIKWGGSPSEGLTESWDGVNWSTENEFNYARSGGVGGGTQNDAVQIGGAANANSCRNLTELWNGTNWVAGPAHPMVNQSSQAAASGNSTDLHAIGSSYVNAADFKCSIAFDGVTWGANPLRPASRHQAGMAGQGASGLAMGGGAADSHPAGVSTTDVYEFQGAFMSGSYLLTKKLHGNFGFSGSQG